MVFQLKLTENLILKDNKTEMGPSGRSLNTTPPTRADAPLYLSYIVAAASKKNPC
jgi:hypothetical protein